MLLLYLKYYRIQRVNIQCFRQNLIADRSHESLAMRKIFRNTKTLYVRLLSLPSINSGFLVSSLIGLRSTQKAPADEVELIIL
jgi:hypothetical protein